MNIVEIEDFVHPETGYQVTVMSELFAKHGHKVTIVTSEPDKIPAFLTSFFDCSNLAEQDAAYEKRTGVQILRMPIYAYVSGRSIYTKKIFECVEKLKPDILFIHADDTMIAMQYLLRAKKLRYPILMDNHQVDMSSRNKLNKLFRVMFRRVFTPIIIKRNIRIVRLVDEHYMQDHYKIPIEQCPIISFGSNTLLFHPDEEVRHTKREQCDIEQDAFVVIYAGKLDEYKDGQFLADALKDKIETKRKLVFVIVGTTNGEYGEKVEATFMQSQNEVKRFPTQKYRDLSPFFQMSDLCVFSRECSLTFYDAQACGLPVLAEDNEVNSARLKEGNGETYSSGDMIDFRKKIKHFADMPRAEFEQIGQRALEFIQKEYDYDKKATEFENLMQEICDEFYGNCR